MDVKAIIEETIRIEGGYSNRSADRGGPTKYGIKQKTLSAYLHRQATIEDVKSVTKELAFEIYEANYYYGPRINTLPEALQPQLFDIAVNSGPRRAFEILQAVLNMAGYEVDQDGALGPQTRAQCVKAYEDMAGYLINAIEEYREHFYEQLAMTDPDQMANLHGWLNRAKLFRVEV